MIRRLIRSCKDKKWGLLPFLLLLLQTQTQVNAQSFYQEYHEPFPLAGHVITADQASNNDQSSGNVRSIAISSEDIVYVATEAGVFQKPKASSNWTALPFSPEDAGPAYAVTTAPDGSLWIGTWKGVFRWQDNQLRSIPGTDGPVSILCFSNQNLYALGPRGIWQYNGKTFDKRPYPIARSLRSAIPDRQGGLWIASSVGLYHVSDRGTEYIHRNNLLISAALRGLALDKKGALWVAGLGGISVLREGKQVRVIRSSDGLPSVFVNCIRRSPDDVMWVGTQTGVVRFGPDGSHSLRFSQRWLLDNQVNDIAFDSEGNAWIATSHGVSALKKKRMTLSEKQAYFYDVLMRRHIREPWIAGQCHLPVAGDTTRWEPEDDDNDGEYTGVYLAMESLRFAVTGLQDAREKAKKAFHFLKFEKDVTGGDGYFARSIVPIAWKDRVRDPNRVYTTREVAEEEVKEPRSKPVEIRWHPSADGKWLWKGDASSDEWCGHMMGYFFYYEMAADDTEKILIREHVASLVDHLIRHRFTMTDADGTHTQWAVWSPELLNHDPEWMPDRAENSMELMAFLKLAYYFTGDEKYQGHYLRLIKEDHYLENMADIPRQNPAWFIYFDVTLQAYLYPILLHCEKDPSILAFYQRHLDAYMERRKNDHSPLINFMYCYARNKRAGLQASLDFLEDTPLDLVDWHIDHTIREDIKLVRTPMLDQVQVSQLQPPSVHATVRWDSDPWEASSGDPHTEREPVFWLFPYWMGRYLRMIPEK